MQAGKDLRRWYIMIILELDFGLNYRENNEITMQPNQNVESFYGLNLIPVKIVWLESLKHTHLSMQGM
jgi:hypothetical protein